jgi:argininosuccinate synthase
MEKEKVVLAYSGGLDTSVIVKWLQDKYQMDVVALIADLGQPENLLLIQQKALEIGAIDATIVDTRTEFVNQFIAPAIKANALYEKKYPLSTALSRPLIAKHLVETARRHNAKAVAHGCTGKGNDQVRFETAIMSLAPDLKIIAPQREWAMSRDEEIDYAKKQGIPVPVTKTSPYSVDENLWGRSAEAGELENPWLEPPPDAYSWTKSPEEAIDRPDYLEISFRSGLPVMVDEEELSLSEIISQVNKRASQAGVGRIDMVENRLIGIKSREIYECPAATVLITAHQELEALTLPRELMHYKYLIEQIYANQIYYGLWFSPLREALQAFIEKSQEHVSGKVKLKLYKGSCQVVGRRSDQSLYDYSLATYESGDKFSHQSAKGFIELWALPEKVWGKKHSHLG